MYLHLGQDTVITCDEIVGIFDLDGTTVSKRTRDFLARATKNGRVISVGYELPKSFLVCKSRGGEVSVYISPLSVATLGKRVALTYTKRRVYDGLTGI